MHRLPCCHPDCPATFKSQHGRTYHIRTVHTTFNGLSVNRELEHASDQGLGHYANSEQDSDGPSQLVDNWDQDRNTVPLDSDSTVHGEKIQHPYLTGKCPSPIILNVQSRLSITGIHYN